MPPSCRGGFVASRIPSSGPPSLFKKEIFWVGALFLLYPPRSVPFLVFSGLRQFSGLGQGWCVYYFLFSGGLHTFVCMCVCASLPSTQFVMLYRAVRMIDSFTRLSGVRSVAII